MKPKSTLRRFLLASTALISVSYTQAAQNWNGGDADDDFWSSLDNWSGALPTWASAINFGGNTRNSAFNDLTADTLIGGINFTNAGSGGNTNAFTLSGNRITLGGNITTTANTAGSTITDVIDLALLLDANRTITTNQQSASVQHNLTISGGISSSGAFGIIKAGSGILSLGGANTYTGTTAVSAGTLRLTNTSAIASSPSLSMANGTTLELRKDTTGGIFTNTRLNPTGIVTLNADRISAGSGQTLTLGGTVVFANSPSAEIYFTGANSYDVGINAMYFNANAPGTYFTLNPTTANAKIGAIRVNTGTTNPDGWGAGTANNVNLYLRGTSTDNTITSITEISGANSQFVFIKDSAASWTVGNIATNKGNNHTISAGTLTLNGTFSANAGSDRKITLSGASTVLNYNNAGAISLTAVTTAAHTGGFIISGGSIDNTSIGGAITTSTFNPKMQWNGNWTFIGTNGAASNLNLGTGVVTLGTSAGTTRTVTVSNALTTLTIGGIISNGTTANALTKAGAGTLRLNGANTYTGATTVSTGTLVVNGSIASSSLTTVASGATIGGSGTVGALTVSTGGFINPGNSPDILSTGNYIQDGLYTAEIAGLTPGITGHDQINVTGAVDIAGGSLNVLFSSGTYAAGNLIFIMLNDGSDGIIGTYTNLALVNLAQGATVTSYGGFDWQISYTANNTGIGTGTFTDGNDIALKAVIPEPGAALIGSLGLLALLRRRRF